ncbi:hypothetical protein [Rhizobium sp. BR 249]|uniref:hypothetical protein n=1 Tax=Rhizobium sp. BR 249 TaxID=3040011 RepID=UPI0039BF595D
MTAFEDFPDADDLILSCDFTEIRAYCYVFDDHDVSYTEVENQGRQIALNLALLDELFFSKRPIILLPTYRVELDNLRRNLRLESLSDLASMLEAVQSEPQLRKAKELAERLSALGPNASQQAVLASLHDIYQNAPALKMLLVNELQPRERLKQLTTQAQFRSPPLGPSREAPPSQNSIDWWNKRLEERRPDAPRSANMIDAVALARLQAINTAGFYKRPCVLVTRSRTMREILADNREQAECKGVYLMHPRLLGLYETIKKSNKTFKEEIEDRYWLLKETVTRLKATGSDFDRDMQPHLARLIDDVHRLWAETDDLTIAASAFSSVPTAQTFRLAEETSIKEIRRFIGDQTPVHELLLKRASEVARDFERSNAEIAVIGVLDQLDREYLVALEERAQRNKSRLDPIYTAKLPLEEMPYSLQIYGDRSVTWLGNSKDAKSILSSFIKSKTADSDYERQVATGYLLSSLMAWEIGLAFFNTAIATDAATTPKHEAYYFRALARRHSTKDIKSETIEKSLRDIIRANAIKQKTRGSQYWDPRYLNEAGILIAIAKEKAPDLVMDNLPEKLAQEPPSIWQDTLASIRNDEDLTVLVLNNVLYYFTKQGDLDNVQKFLTTLQEIFSDIPSSKIPPATRHTMIMARFALAEGAREEMDSLLNELEALKSSERISENLRASIDEDLIHLGRTSGAAGTVCI